MLHLFNENQMKILLNEAIDYNQLQSNGKPMEKSEISCDFTLEKLKCYAIFFVLSFNQPNDTTTISMKLAVGLHDTVR